MTDRGNGPWLVLWDIDHTLIETRGVGAELYQQAFEAATGMQMREKADVTGQTEPAILTATLRLHGIVDNEPYQTRYKHHLAKAYEQNREKLQERGRVIPGAREALASLAARSYVVQSVLSGNLQAVSKTKLQVFDLDQYIDLAVGAYVDDDTDRPKLVAVAQQRAQRKYGAKFTAANTVVIGDSTHDIETGIKGGAHSMGVASGSDSTAILDAAGADVVIPGLDDAIRFREALAKVLGS